MDSRDNEPSILSSRIEILCFIAHPNISKARLEQSDKFLHSNISDCQFLISFMIKTVNCFWNSQFPVWISSCYKKICYDTPETRQPALIIDISWDKSSFEDFPFLFNFHLSKPKSNPVDVKKKYEIYIIHMKCWLMSYEKYEIKQKTPKWKETFFYIIYFFLLPCFFIHFS
jgi:hypothetical protein